MLDDRERRILADIESRLARDDPRFVARMRLPRRTRTRVVLSAVLITWWLSAIPVLAMLWNVAGAAALTVVVTVLISVAWPR